MSDIKERLRNSNIHVKLKHEAADYIEQLEKKAARYEFLWEQDWFKRAFADNVSIRLDQSGNDAIDTALSHTK
jgi:hypothetical protein